MNTFIVDGKEYGVKDGKCVHGEGDEIQSVRHTGYGMFILVNNAWYQVLRYYNGIACKRVDSKRN